MSLLRGWLAICCLLSSTLAFAQRVQFPTMVEQPLISPPATPANLSTQWTSAQGTFAAPSNSPMSAVPYDPYTPPVAAPQAAFPQPAYSPYSASPYTAPPTSPYVAQPYTGAPYGSTPGALYPEGVQFGQMSQPSFSMGQTLKFMQDIRLRWTWLAPMGSQSLGVNDVETNVTFAVPFFKTTSPLMFTPGFAIHFWDGPVTQAPYYADLPARTYDAYLDTAWYPQVNNWLSAQLGVRVGAYTDFNTFTTNSIRIMGRGLGVISITPTLQFALGVVYIDRVLIKLLPAGGLIWTPNADARYEFLIPNPRGSKRLTTLGNTEVWWYITGEYGGGSWTAQREGLTDQFDYNDLRVSGGLEAFGMRGFYSFFEVGYAWDRKIIYRYGSPDFPASDTVMLRAGVAY